MSSLLRSGVMSIVRAPVRYPPRRFASQWSVQQRPPNKTRFQQQGSPFQNTNSRRPVLVAGVVVVGTAGYVTLHLERVPISDRLRFNDCSREKELQVGAEGLEEILSQNSSRLSRNDDPRLLRIQRIAKRLIDASEKVLGRDEGGYEWRVYLLQKDEANAFVLPGGKIFVYTGILPLATNDDALAGVLGHEMAHQRLRHIAERISRSKVIMGLRLLLSVYVDDSILTAFGIQTLLELPHSRQAELEADYVGLMISASACYDPEEAVHFWERMAKIEREHGSQPWLQFTSTHPASKKRISELTKHLEAAKKAREESCSNTGDLYSSFRSSGFRRS